MIEYFLRKKAAPITFLDGFFIFDALPFMWLLSVAMVKIIEIRSDLHHVEEQKTSIEQEKEVNVLQLQTLRQVVRGVQHHVNNPLAIIDLSVEKAKRYAGDNDDVKHQLEIIAEESNRIASALMELSKIKSYATKPFDEGLSIAGRPS
jgi:signal transduction histidine kinase